MSTVAFITFIIALATVLGIILGEIKIKGIGLGIGGVLFSGIFIGHFAHEFYGLTIRTAGTLTAEGEILSYVQEFGLMLFVYAIGVQVGPSFFSSLRSVGAKLIGLVAIILLMGCTIALILHFSGFLTVDAMVGVYAGAITNTPSLGAGTQMIRDMSAVLADKGLVPSEIGFNELIVPSAYAMAYPFGVVGLLLTMILIRIIFKVDIEKEAQKYQESKQSGRPAISTANVQVKNLNMVGKQIIEIPAVKLGKVVCSRIKRNNDLFTPRHELELQEGDVIHLVGIPKFIDETIELLGQRTNEVLTTRGSQITVEKINVTSNHVCGKKIESLNLESRFNIVISRIIRSGVQFIPAPNMQLQFGDTLNVIGHKEDIQKAAKIVGNSNAELHKVAMLPIFIGLILGILLGNIPVSISGVPAPMKLGIAGGPLVVAILLSRFGQALTFNKMHWNIPLAGLSALREIGICLFLSIVGINAGASGFWETLTKGPGFSWMCFGVLITFIPLFTIGVFAYKIAKVNYLTLCGMLAGSSTNPPALAFANSIHSNPEAASLGYATVYPLTMFLRILSPQIMIIIAVLISGL